MAHRRTEPTVRSGAEWNEGAERGDIVHRTLAVTTAITLFAPIALATLDDRPARSSGGTQHQHCVARAQGGATSQGEVHGRVFHQQRHRFGVIEFHGSCGLRWPLERPLVRRSLRGLRTPGPFRPHGNQKRKVALTNTTPTGFHAGHERRRQLQMIPTLGQQQVRKTQAFMLANRNFANAVSTSAPIGLTNANRLSDRTRL